MCGSETTRGLSRKRSSLSASGTTKTSDCRIAVEQKAISREVSEASMPTRDLNHWRSSSTREISAMGVLQTNEASRVRSSKDCSGSVSYSKSREVGVKDGEPVGKPGSRKWGNGAAEWTLRMETFPIGIPLDYIGAFAKINALAVSGVPTFKEPCMKISGAPNFLILAVVFLFVLAVAAVPAGNAQER